MAETAVAHSPPEGVSWDEAHGLRSHLEAVASAARDAAKDVGCSDWAFLAGLWHDLGKYTPSFQRYIRGQGGPTSHKLAGAALALDRCHPAVGQILALAIAGHHGGIPAFRDGAHPLQDRQPQATAELADCVLGGAPGDILGPASTPDPEAANAKLATLPASDRLLFLELLTRLLFSCLVDADYRDTAAYYNREQERQRSDAVSRHADLPTLSRRLDAALGLMMATAQDTPVNRWRAGVLKECREAAEQPVGIFDLTVPTGGGKTLSAMSFALRHAAHHGLRRVIVVVPYTSIIEQNAARYSGILGSENVVEHHSAWDPEQAFRDLAPRVRWGALRRHKLLAENWNAPVIVTTSVQFLESLHANRPAACRKLHNVARSVVILDEVQSLPTHLLKPTLDTLRVLAQGFGTSIVCSTATQPALTQRVDGTGISRIGLGQATPIVRSRAPLFASLSRVQAHWPSDPREPISWTELAGRVLSHPRVLVIVHRRKDARNLAALLGDDVLHLSATMLPAHRSQVLAKVRTTLANPGQPCRVVSTQLVEAGVDLDFPVVYRAMAGLDSLAQAAGRCNREGLNPDKGRFHVFVAPTPPPPGVLQQAQSIAMTMLAEAGGAIDLDDPDLHRRFYSRLYDLTATDARAISALRKGLYTHFPEVALRYRLIEDEWQMPVVVPWPELDQPTLRAIARLKLGYADAESFRRIRRATVSARRETVLEWAQRGVVSVPPNHPIPVLNMESWPQLYHPRFGLDTQADPLLRTEDLVL